MLRLKRKVAVLMFVVSACEVNGLLFGALPVMAESSSSYGGFSLDCSSGTCTRSYMGTSFASTSAHKSIPEPSLVLGILTAGSLMFMCRKKRGLSHGFTKKVD